MLPRVLTVDPDRPDPETLARAARALLAGELVAFPTETVYGLGARADQDAAVAKVFAVKGRPGTHPLIAHVHSVQAARSLAGRWSPEAEALAAAFWPGALTLVVPWVPGTVSAKVTAGGATVALRVPSHPVALGLVRAARVPVAAPSANRYQHLSPTCAAHVRKSLGDRVPWLLDAGPTPLGLESSVVDTTPARPVLLRPGAVSLARLQQVVPTLCTRASEPIQVPSGPSRSPGLDPRHYAPAVPMTVLPREALLAHVGNAPTAPLGVLLHGAPIAPSPGVWVEHGGSSPEVYGARLYAALHRLEDLGCGSILVEAPPEEPGWATVADRLRRASTPSRSGGTPP